MATPAGGWPGGGTATPNRPCCCSSPAAAACSAASSSAWLIGAAACTAKTAPCPASQMRKCARASTAALFCRWDDGRPCAMVTAAWTAAARELSPRPCGRRREGEAATAFRKTRAGGVRRARVRGCWCAICSCKTLLKTVTRELCRPQTGFFSLLPRSSCFEGATSCIELPFKMSSATDQPTCQFLVRHLGWQELVRRRGPLQQIIRASLPQRDPKLHAGEATRAGAPRKPSRASPYLWRRQQSFGGSHPVAPAGSQMAFSRVGEPLIGTSDTPGASM